MTAKPTSMTAKYEPLARKGFSVLVLIVSYLLLSPDVATVPVPYNWMTGAAHFCVHAALIIVGLFAFRTGELRVLLALSLYAFVTELLQIKIPGRFFDFADISLNLCGVLVGYCSARFSFGLLESGKPHVA